jgi:hypothetical protein
MRPFYAVFALALVACSGVSQPVTGRAYDEFGCQVGCDRCAPEAQCVSSPYLPACVARCVEASDCGGGEKCVYLGGDTTRSPVCISARMLMVCHDAPCTVAPMCRDATTSLQPLPTFWGACGLAITPCDSGCDSTTGNCK